MQSQNNDVPVEPVLIPDSDIIQRHNQGLIVYLKRLWSGLNTTQKILVAGGVFFAGFILISFVSCIGILLSFGGKARFTDAILNEERSNWEEQEKKEQNGDRSGRGGVGIKAVATAAMRIKPGMSPDQVEELLGEPDFVNKLGDDVIFFRYNGGQGQFGFSADESVFVFFAENGRPTGGATMVTNQGKNLFNTNH